MKPTINERFDQLIKRVSKSPAAFAEKIGKAPTVVYSILKGRNKPGYELLEAVIEAYPNVNSEWLMRGEGEMFRPDERPAAFGDEIAARIEAHFAKAEQFYQETIRSQAQQIEKLLSLLGKTEGTAMIRPLWPEAAFLQVAE